MIDTKELDNLIIGRVEPHIYAFSTNTIPNYLKIGDTYRPVSERLREWKQHFPLLKKEYENSAKVDNDIYFRDFSVHRFLENDKNKIRLQPNQFPQLYYSNEFFKDTSIKDVDEAIKDIQLDYKQGNQKYQFYNALDRLPEIFNYARTESYEPRKGTQDITIENFKNAVANGRNNLLMYAVMRFGKSFTAMCCATEINAKTVVIVSGKADIKEEWKKTVESHIKFNDYNFISSEELKRNNEIISETLKENGKVVVFLTLQDLMGEDIKEKHKEIFANEIDLLLVDESHFGARAEKYGQVLKNEKYEQDIVNKKDLEDIVDLEEVEKHIKILDAKITIHMSGTPYRILMSDEFEKEDIIAFYQFTDIVDKQKEWDKENILKDDVKEWDNPYFGFPQMIRFAFNPNKSSVEKLNQLKNNGYTYAFSELLKPLSIKKADDNSHTKFKYESEILELLEAIDGGKKDDNLLSFLNYDKIKEGKLCNHIVIVLPYCASCDAMETLIKNNASKFKNLNNYEILNVAGWNMPKSYSTIPNIKKAISNFEKDNKKTITLTVNRLLTGCTIPEWDTMIYLKDTASAQEYDQSIFRLQSQFVKSYTDDDGNKIKINMKPQTLLVDFDPNRMFTMQEQKAQIYNVNIDNAGNSKLEERIYKELEISPIITLNKNKIVKVVPNDIMEAVSNYKKDKGIKEEALAIPVDLNILNFELIKNIIDNENEIDSKAGLTTPAYKGEEDEEQELDLGNVDDKHNTENEETNNQPTSMEKSEEQSLSKKIQNYYTRILLFAFLTKDKVISLSDIINCYDKNENIRIANNLGLNKNALNLFNENYNKWALRKLDYSIQDLNSLSSSADINTALKKFGKLGEAIVITPNNICDNMTNLLPNDFFKKSQKRDSKYLDIAGTSGEFALSLYKRMKKCGFKDKYIKNAIYTIPKSSICYELIRKLYELLGLNIENISTIYAQDIIKNINDYDKIKLLLTQNKKFNEIKLTDENLKGGNMKFDAIVGNPPYQEEVKLNNSMNGQNPRTNIFQHFQNLALKIAQERTCLIFPGIRWIHQSGKGLKQFGYELINNTKLDKVLFYPDARDIFKDSGIPDGITIVLIDIHKNSNRFEYRYIDKNNREPIICDSPKDKLFIINPDDAAIVKKINDFVIVNKLDYLHSSILPRSLFDIDSDFVEKNQNVIKIYKDGSPIDYSSEIKLLTNDKAGSAGRSKWYIVNKNIINKNKQYINEWQVVVSSAHAGGQEGRDNQISIIDNHSAFGRARVALKSFKSEEEAKNFLKFAQSKLIKYAFLLSDEALSSLAKYVPDLLNYSNNNHLIDFTESIDEQLYNLIKLEDKEIEYIEKMIKNEE